MKIFIYAFSILSFLLSLGCESPLTRKNIRSPHMPVFSQITPNEESSSNPYWVRFSTINDDTQITLNDSYLFVPDKPTAIGSIGTHYRLKSNYYGYVMTDGIGIQHDSVFWTDSKAGLGAFVGINNSWGVQAFYAHKVGALFNGNVILYTSLQRRGGYHFVACEEAEGQLCRPEAPTSTNRMRSQHNAIDLLIGTELGRFKMGEKGNTTLNFKVELGYNKILNRTLDFEQYPSNFQENDENMVFSLHTGITLF